MKPDFPIKIGKRVILTDDLTRYHRSLSKNEIGTIVGSATQAIFNSGYNDRFVKVKFEYVTIDVLWKGIDYCS